MEMHGNNFTENNPPTLGDMLGLVAGAAYQGFTVISKDGDISYSFCAPESIADPAAGETWIPITPDEAVAMSEDLAVYAPEELMELGKHEESRPTS